MIDSIRRRFKYKYFFPTLAFMFFLNYMGVFTHIFEVDYETAFHYPFYENVDVFVRQLRNNESPIVPPINVYNYTFLTNLDQKCKGDDRIRLVILVKSAAANFERRQAIRSTWGHEKRFSDVSIRTVFILGMVDDSDIQLSIIHEKLFYEDIVHVKFVDSYYNNTIKTMTAMKWAVDYCPNASYYFFSDDDMYVSPKNILRFLRNPVEYPKNLEGPIETRKWIYSSNMATDVVFYAGYVFKSSPLRHKTSKWYVSLEEYPYDMWPPYVTAGGYVLSREALFIMFYTSMYTKHFRFDDIFLGLVAKKAGIEPFHSDEFYFYYKDYSATAYKYAISVHGYSKPALLRKVWTDQKAAGNA